MSDNLNKQPEGPRSSGYVSPVLEWIKVLAPAIISWPVVGLVVTLAFHRQIGSLIDKFSDSPESAAEIGAVKIRLGKPVLPPESREATEKAPVEVVRPQRSAQSDWGYWPTRLYRRVFSDVCNPRRPAHRNEELAASICLGHLRDRQAV